jgi:hypothetical protein
MNPVDATINDEGPGPLTWAFPQSLVAGDSIDEHAEHFARRRRRRQSGPCTGRCTLRCKVGQGGDPAASSENSWGLTAPLCTSGGTSSARHCTIRPRSGRYVHMIGAAVLLR